ncbi:hypothetical protein PtB15_1B584 [Puccinia triticina]|nr:hypothetical protein PtB15_1B584 [Puccinia triticina]
MPILHRQMFPTNPQSLKAYNHPNCQPSTTLTDSSFPFHQSYPASPPSYPYPSPTSLRLSK